jgi:hypothetical protein
LTELSPQRFTPPASSFQCSARASSVFTSSRSASASLFPLGLVCGYTS